MRQRILDQEVWGVRKLGVVLVAAGLALWMTALPAPASTDVLMLSAGCPGGSPFCFSPATATDSTDGTVTWRNMSDANHTVSRCRTSVCPVGGGSGKDSGFGDSGNIAANGGTFSHQFTSPGTYNYYCSVHGYDVMHGSVTVQGDVAPAQLQVATTTTATTAPTATTATTATTVRPTTTFTTFRSLTTTTLFRLTTTTTRFFAVTPTTTRSTGTAGTTGTTGTARTGGESLLLGALGFMLVSAGIWIRLTGESLPDRR